MAIKFRFVEQADYLLVEASGYDGSLEEVRDYGLAVVNACKAGGHKRVLCDERQLEYRLGDFDIFNCAEFIASQAAGLVKAAIVCHERFIADAKFWETVAVNRGLRAAAFKDVASARKWLLADRPAGGEKPTGKAG